MGEVNRVINLGQLSIYPRDSDILFDLFHCELGNPISIGSPLFEVNGSNRSAFTFIDILDQYHLAHGGMETSLRYSCGHEPQLHLDVIVRSFPSSCILRFKFRLKSAVPAYLTKSREKDQISYFSLDQADFDTFTLTEYQLSHFDPVQHSYMPDRVNYPSDSIVSGMQFIGPITLFHSVSKTILAAYEHGSDHPQSFLHFVTEDMGVKRRFTLRAEKGNYYSGQQIGLDKSWESIWFELGLFPGKLEKFLPEYRGFFLDEVCENRESRKPYIYYNTWNYQERQKYFNNRPYLESMNATRILSEIEIAHQMGVDIFVIDTGWYEKTGDWIPSKDRFPQGLRDVKNKLEKFGMKLGLWFNPTVAALTSEVFLKHPEWEMEWEGKPRSRGPIWETEESAGMCLASDYVDYYIDVMVRLNKELGVSYFKWDGISQYGCDSSHHNHGLDANTPEERRSCYAFQMGQSMIRIVDEVTRRCPGVIVDFDITEGGRFAGLGFLSVGKYFLVNNGPYFHDFNIPRSVKIDPDTINVFFYPGPARPRVCRQGIKYDEFIPSILFLTHYFPDPPRSSQSNSVASLVLGGNGIWGDLLALTKEDIEYFSGQIGLYKLVADSVTRSFPQKRGFPGSSPEIYEKIDPETSSGLVVFFTVTPGELIYITQPLNQKKIGAVIGADKYTILDGGRLQIVVNLKPDDAAIVYILSKE